MATVTLEDSVGKEALLGLGDGRFLPLIYGDSASSGED